MMRRVLPESSRLTFMAPGKTWGFVSELVHELKVIDGQGVPHTVGPADDLFKAVVGGVGAAGLSRKLRCNAETFQCGAEV